MTIQLRWLHQFQFAGYYMALEKGYYKEAGLDVKLLEGGPSALNPLDELMSGRCDFAITSSGVVINRMEGKPVQAVAAIMQTSPIVWITLKSANIQTVEDMAGKRAMLMPPPESAELLTVLRQDQYNNLNVEFQHTSFDVEELVRGKTDAYDGYISNEPYVLTQQGIEYNLINPRDYGVNFYADVLVTRESLAEQP
ncbi:ABC transporter substrate-binding protein [Marinobacterium stanieri]|uniref:ABC transporter substrate-binding protein n=1 Tax=Marinobacterium stanieri TaxID=49186 RepID=UPI0003039831|nr:ABC transporter substrate-binding protein [Marinobacterium stanieri]